MRDNELEVIALSVPPGAYLIKPSIHNKKLVFVLYTSEGYYCTFCNDLDCKHITAVKNYVESRRNIGSGVGVS